LVGEPVGRLAHLARSGLVRPSENRPLLADVEELYGELDLPAYRLVLTRNHVIGPRVVYRLEVYARRVARYGASRCYLEERRVQKVVPQDLDEFLALGVGRAHAREVGDKYRNTLNRRPRNVGKFYLRECAP